MAILYVVQGAGTTVSIGRADVQNMKRRTVYVFPRVRIREGASRHEHFTIGPITVLPDIDATWQNQFSTNRPSWLQMFRDFPDVGSDREGDEARGSIVVANEDSWIEQHISRLVGVFYFLGLSANDWRVPSEALSYFGFMLTNSPSNMVELVSKSGRFIEHNDSIRFPPPLALRGVGRTFSLGLEKAPNKTLCDQFCKNPFDNLAVACFHLYRTQWGDCLHSPHEQDFAAYCACLEAALKIERDYPANLYLALRDRYSDYSGLERWVHGLYSERSVFNHGATVPLDPKSTDQRMRDWILFRSKRGNWSVAREICRDVIHRTLDPYKSSLERQTWRRFDRADTQLRQMLLSEGTWSNIAKVFTEKGAIANLRSIEEENRDVWIQLALQAEADLDWRFVPRPINEHRLICVLRTASAGMGIRARGRGNWQEERIWSALYAVTTPQEDEEPRDALQRAIEGIRSWVISRKRDGAGQSVPEDVDSAVLSIVVQIAQYFEN